MKKPVRRGSTLLALMLLGVPWRARHPPNPRPRSHPWPPSHPRRRRRQPGYGQVRPSRCGSARSSRAMG